MPKCNSDTCSAEAFKSGYCIDCYRKHKDEIKTESAVFDFTKLNSVDECVDWIRTNRPEIPMERVNELKKHFQGADHDKDEELNVREVSVLMQKIGMSVTSHNEVRKMFDDVDHNKDGKVNFYEFFIVIHPPPQGDEAAAAAAAAPAPKSGKAAFFEQQINKSAEAAGATLSNEEKLRRDAAVRKQRKEEEKAVKDAEEKKKQEDAERRAAFTAKQKAAFEAGDN